MGRTAQSPKRAALFALIIVLATVAGACTNSERQGIRVARTATVEPGVRAILDNCPGPEEIIFSVRDEVLWSVENPNAGADAAASEADPPETTETAADSDDPAAAGPPGLLDVLIGTAPDGWTTTQEFEQTIQDDIRYTIRTEPDGKSLEFAFPSLATRTLFDGETSATFQPESLSDPCEQPADIGQFFRNVAVLGALGITSAALVLVALITLLFVITRRFSRIRTLERRAAQLRAAEEVAEDQPYSPV